MKFCNSKKLFRVVTLLNLFLALVFFVQSSFGQTNDDKIKPSSELMLLVEKAEQNEYNVKWVGFCCSLKVRGGVLFGNINKFINEGDIFTRQNLHKSLAALSKLKAIYPVSIENVSVDLDDEERIINITYNIRERKK